MKKRLIAILCCLSLILLCACANTDEAGENISLNDQGAVTSEEKVEGEMNQSSEKTDDVLLPPIEESEPAPAPEPELNISLGAENIEILGITPAQLAGMNREDLRKAFKSATGLDDAAIDRYEGELTNTDPDKYSSISYDYDEREDEVNIKVFDNALVHDPKTSYAEIHLSNFPSIQCIFWGEELDGIYISGVNLTKDMTIDEILEMLDADTIREIGEPYTAVSYSVRGDVKSIDGRIYSNLILQVTDNKVDVDFKEDGKEYCYSYIFEDGKLNGLQISIYN